MKHVFLVHSTTTELVSRAVLRRERVPEGDELLLCSRRHVPAGPRLRWKPIHYRHNPESFPSCTNPLRSRALRRRFDLAVANWVGGERFVFYTPQTSQRFMQLLMSHPLCTGFSFIEEGLGSYKTRDQVDRSEPPRALSRWDRVCFGGRLRDGHFFAAGHRNAFGVGEEVFPGFEKRVILDGAFDTVSPELPAGVECILVLSGLPAYGLLDLSVETRALERALDDCHAAGIRRVHYRYHPSFTGSTLTAPYMALFERHAERFLFEELPAPIVLEAIRPAVPGLVILTNVSSIAIYAARNGCSVLSYARYVEKEDPPFGDTILSLPDVFHRSVHYLGDGGAPRRDERPRPLSTGLERTELAAPR